MKLTAGEARRIAKRLKEFGQTRKGLDVDVETQTLIRRNPFAFLIAVAFNRGMRAQRAWRIPTEIARKGCLNPELLASKSVTALEELLEGLAVRPRFPGAKTLSEAAKLVCQRFGGDAAAIWKDASPDEVKKTLQKIHGIGPGIASMATRILRDDFGCFSEQESQIDVKPDVHLVRVFRRLGIIDDDSANKAIRAAAKCLNPEFPGELDWAAWEIGRRWCRPTDPKCAQCPLTEDCAKRM